MKKSIFFILFSIFYGTSSSMSLIDETNDKEKCLREFSCLNCKTEYNLDEEIVFDILYTGKDKIGVKFGLKVKIGEKWMLLVEDIGSAEPNENPINGEVTFEKLDSNAFSAHSLWMFYPNDMREISWNKQVSLSIETYEKYKNAIHLQKDEGWLVPYDIQQGGKLKLFVYCGLPFIDSNDPKRDLFEFNLLGKNENEN